MNARLMDAPSRRLPAGLVADQSRIQADLDVLRRKGVTLDGVFVELARWLDSVGYFAHLTDQNEYITIFDAEYNLPFRLQINYSRLTYKAPSGARLACPLCIENIGMPGKELLRVFELELGGEAYFTHPTPFPLHPNHFVLNLRQHAPMEVSGSRLRQMADFAGKMPRWLVASNSDVAWAGASILGHHHVQVFRDLQLPLESARPSNCLKESPQLSAWMVHWPCPVLRLEGDSAAVLDAAERTIAAWKARAPGACTFNYLMRAHRTNGLQLHLIFRHPDFRTPQELQHIKAEGVGIVEMAGEVIVPPMAKFDREANRLYFLAEGQRVIRGIIGGNAPNGPLFGENEITQLSATAVTDR